MMATINDCTILQVYVAWQTFLKETLDQNYWSQRPKNLVATTKLYGGHQISRQYASRLIVINIELIVIYTDFITFTDYQL